MCGERKVGDGCNLFGSPLGVRGDVRVSYAAFEVTLGIKFVAKLTLFLRIHKSKENLVTLGVLGS